MDANHWNTIEPIIDEVLEIPRSKRFQYVRSKWGDTPLEEEIVNFLKAIERSKEADFLGKSSQENDAVIKDIYQDYCITSFIGRRIGAYKIIENIGQGGMGNVFKAKRVDGQFQQCVAIKIVRKDIHPKKILERFKVEQQVLAKLSHPNIAKIFDGGITKDGHPYLIMEYIEGKPIDLYCNTKKLSIDERLVLFKHICAAVGYAHQSLIIHCDLKVQNIHVTTNGTIKILDFGIAELLKTKLPDSQQTQEHLKKQYWTPHNAAPEQVKGEAVSTATDIYALGILLHKLLTDQYPFEFSNKTLAHIRPKIIHAKPNTLDKSLTKNIYLNKTAENRQTTSKKLKAICSGDLEAIIAKALQKNAYKRYSSVHKLAEDIDHYQQHLPVVAQPGNFGYRSKKFIRRNKKPLIIGVSIFLMLTFFSIFYTLQITQQKNYAQQQTQKTEQLMVFLMDLFEANRPAVNHGKTVTASELLIRARKRASLLDKQPDIQAQMYDVIGRIYRRLGVYDKSYELLTKSVSIRESLFGMYHAETLSSMDHLGILLTQKGAYEAADSLLQKVLHIRNQLPTPNKLDIAITQSNLAYVLRKQASYQKAEALYKKSIQAQTELTGPDNPRVIETLSSLGTTLHYQGKYEETEKIFREVLDRRRKLLSPIHPKLAQSINNLGAVLMNRGLFKEAEKLFRESLAMRQQLYGSNHPKVALMLNNLGIVLKNQEKYEEAATFFKQALAMREVLIGPTSMSTGISMFCLGQLYLNTQQPDSALLLFRQANHIFSQKFNEIHSLEARSYLLMGSAYLNMGKLLKASQFLRTGFQQVQQVHAPSSLEYSLAEKQFGMFMLTLHRFQEAQSLFKHALQTLQTIEPHYSIRQKQLTRLLAKAQQTKTASVY